MTKRVGVIGLGAMGFPMASTLLARGFDVVAHSRSAARVDELTGARLAADPMDLGSRVDVVVLSLPAEPDVRSVLLGERGVVQAATRPRLVLDTSTISPDGARSLAADLQPFGIGYLDAPVSGGPSAAQTGTLSVMVGGTPEDLAAAGPVLAAIAGVVSHCGPVGAGQICKACNQLIVMGTLELVAETLVVAQRSGLEPRVVREALLGGYAASRVLELHGQRMIDRDFAPGGKARFNLKDIDIIRELAAGAHLELPAFGATAEQFLRLIAAGGGELDNAALVSVVEGSRERLASQGVAP